MTPNRRQLNQSSIFFPMSDSASEYTSSSGSGDETTIRPHPEYTNKTLFNGNYSAAPASHTTAYLSDEGEDITSSWYEHSEPWWKLDSLMNLLLSGIFYLVLVLFPIGTSLVFHWNVNMDNSILPSINGLIHSSLYISFLFSLCLEEDMFIRFISREAITGRFMRLLLSEITFSALSRALALLS